MFTEDLAQFFNAAEFADQATLDSVAVVGIFEKNYAITDPGSGMLVQKLAFLLPTADVPVNPVGKSLVLNAVTYRIAGIDPDGSDRSIVALLLEFTA